MASRRRAGLGPSSTSGVGGTRTTGRVNLPRRSSSGRVIKENLKYGRPHALFERVFDPDQQSRETARAPGLKSILQLESLSELPDFREHDVSSCLVCCAPCGHQPLLAATLTQLSQILNSSAEHPANLLSSVLNFDVSQLTFDQVMCSVCAQLFTELRQHEARVLQLRDSLFKRMSNSPSGTPSAATGDSSVPQPLPEPQSEGDAAASAADVVAEESAVIVPEAVDLLSDQFSGSMLGLTAFAPPPDEDDEEEDDEDDNEDEEEQEDEEATNEGVHVLATSVADINDVERQLASFIEISQADSGEISVADGHVVNGTGDGIGHDSAALPGVTADGVIDDAQLVEDLIVLHKPATVTASQVSGDSWPPEISDVQHLPASAVGTDESPQLPCPLCPQIFLTEAERSSHTARHMEETVQCELCSETLVRRNMPAHRASHGVSTSAGADNAAADGGGENQLDQSEQAQLLESFVCAFCGKAFECQARLNVHVKIRHGRSGGAGEAVRRPRGRPRRTDALAPRPGTCQYCGVYIKVDLQGHVNRYHTMVKPFECETCGQRLVSRHALAEHRQVFHSEGHRCDVCGMMFARKKQLSVHAWRRHGVGGVTCRVCGKSFARSDTLDGHMRCHQRPMACQLCPARFPFKRELRNHEHLRHGLHGEVPADNDYLPGEAYRCSKCGRCYGSWAARDRHVCDAGALCDLFVCQLCGDWSTRYEGDMVKHMRNLHNIDADTILIADVDQAGEEESGVVEGDGDSTGAAVVGDGGVVGLVDGDQHVEHVATLDSNSTVPC